VTLLSNDIYSTSKKLSSTMSKYNEEIYITCSGFQTPGTANDSSTSAPHKNFTSTGPAALLD